MGARPGSSGPRLCSLGPPQRASSGIVSRPRAGFLEVGVRLGYWSRRKADGVAESVREGYGIRSIRRQLLR